MNDRDTERPTAPEAGDPERITDLERITIAYLSERIERRKSDAALAQLLLSQSETERSAYLESLRQRYRLAPNDGVNVASGEVVRQNWKELLS